MCSESSTSVTNSRHYYYQPTCHLCALCENALPPGGCPSRWLLCMTWQIGGKIIFRQNCTNLHSSPQIRSSIPPCCTKKQNPGHQKAKTRQKECMSCAACRSRLPNPLLYMWGSNDPKVRPRISHDDSVEEGWYRYTHGNIQT